MEMASYFEISHGFNDTSNFKYLFRELVELGMPERYQHVAYDYIRRNLSEEGKKIFNLGYHDHIILVAEIMTVAEEGTEYPWEREKGKYIKNPHMKWDETEFIER